VWSRRRELVATWPGLKDAWYVEGVVMSTEGLAIDHAWVEATGGALLDPTLAIGDRFPAAYFAGNRYTSDEIAHLVHDQGDIGPIDYGNTPGMQRAYHAMFEAYPPPQPTEEDKATARRTMTAQMDAKGKSPKEIHGQLALMGLLPESGEPAA
jgi:hypothetical protein